MKTSIESSFDFRQSPYWAKYMKRIGWQVETLGEVQLYIRTIPYVGSFIKIQHPFGKIPFKEIDGIAKKYRAIFVIIEPVLSPYKEEEFLKNGYCITKMHHAPTATRKIVIDTPLEDIVSSFSENAKRNLKRAGKNNLKMKLVFGKDDKKNEYFEQFFTLQKSLTDMKKFYAPGYDESKKKYEALRNGSFFVFAYDKSKNEFFDMSFPRKRESRTRFRVKPGMTMNPPIAAVWYGYHKGVITYLQTGITQKGYDTLANYLLVLEGIKMGKKLKCKVFDFESIYDPRYPNEAKRWKGYSEFKSRFHGKEIFYPPSWIKVYSPPFRWFYRMSAHFLP